MISVYNSNDNLLTSGKGFSAIYAKLSNNSYFAFTNSIAYLR